MGQANAVGGSFMIQILNAQNAEWQGTVTWMDGKESRQFRSMLELLSLIESAMNTAPLNEPN